MRWWFPDVARERESRCGFRACSTWKFFSSRFYRKLRSTVVTSGMTFKFAHFFVCHYSTLMAKFWWNFCFDDRLGIISFASHRFFFPFSLDKKLVVLLIGPAEWYEVGSHRESRLFSVFWWECSNIGEWFPSLGCRCMVHLSWRGPEARSGGGLLWVGL